jgi:putative hydrolase of the HAD superfamily
MIFDLGGVYFKDGTTLAIKRFEEILGICQKKLRKVFGEYGYGRAYRLGKIDEKEFWKDVLKFLKIELDVEIIDVLKDIWHSSYKPNAGMKSLVRKFRKDYQVAVMSNNIRERVHYLNNRYGLDKEFDVYVYSYQYCLMKPDPRIVDITIDKLGVAREEVIIIDDRIKVVESFKKMKIITLLFNSFEQIERDISNILICI